MHAAIDSTLKDRLINQAAQMEKVWSPWKMEFSQVWELHRTNLATLTYKTINTEVNLPGQKWEPRVRLSTIPALIFPTCGAFMLEHKHSSTRIWSCLMAYPQPPFAGAVIDEQHMPCRCFEIQQMNNNTQASRQDFNALDDNVAGVHWSRRWVLHHSSGIWWQRWTIMSQRQHRRSPVITFMNFRCLLIIIPIRIITPPSKEGNHERYALISWMF